MTAESLKTFITLPTTTIYKNGGGAERGAHQKAKLFCFALFLAAFCVTVSCYQIWSFLRTNKLQAEVDQLKDTLENMRKRMGLEMFDDLDEFENLYDPQAEGHPENEVFAEDDFDDDIDDEEYDEVYDLDSELSLPGVTDDVPGENEGDDDDFETGSGFLKFHETDDDYELHRRLENRHNPRKPRALPQHFPNSVPIVEESYAVRRNRTHSSTDDRLKQVLMRKSASPKMYYDWDQADTNRVAAPSATTSHHTGHHQSPPARRHLKKFLERRGGHPTPFAVRQQHETRAAAAVTRHNSEQQQARNYQESVAHPEMIAPPPNRRSTRRKVIRQAAPQPKLIAVQFSGDTSKFSNTTNDTNHHHFGDGHLAHHLGMYDSWKVDSWVDNQSLNQSFSMEDGNLTVKQMGLYYIYAQIHYYDLRDKNGYVILRNNKMILQCFTMTHTSHAVMKSNTCHTSGLVLLQKGDVIRITDMGNHRRTIFMSGHSFFGLFQLSGEMQQPQPQHSESQRYTNLDQSSRFF